jgi:AraC family transcriptional regulator
MRVAVETLGPAREPHMRENHEQVLAMLLRPGSIEMGRRTCELSRFAYDCGEMILPGRHVETWARTDSLHYLSVAISDAALRAACNGMASEVELRSAPKLVDARLGALVGAVNAERIAGFPSGRLFLDSVEQALAVALVRGYAVRHHSVWVHRGGLGPTRLRKVTELVRSEIEDELSLDKMAEAAGLSAAHFSQMFRKSTGESPHRFVLRHRIERAKEMLLAPEVRVLDVAIACGFKTQQHFARVFRRACGASPTDYRQEFLSPQSDYASEDASYDTPAFAAPASAPKLRRSPKYAQLKDPNSIDASR